MSTYEEESNMYERPKAAGAEPRATYKAVYSIKFAEYNYTLRSYGGDYSPKEIEFVPNGVVVSAIYNNSVIFEFVPWSGVKNLTQKITADGGPFVLEDVPRGMQMGRQLA